MHASLDSRRRGAAVALLAAFAVLLAFAGCSKSETAHRELTERQRDSILGKSILPGASVVTRALSVSDQAAARAASMDAQTGTSDTP
jgi:hypothetical protein